MWPLTSCKRVQYYWTQEGADDSFVVPTFQHRHLVLVESDSTTCTLLA